jgi:hypothetical protein
LSSRNQKPRDYNWRAWFERALVRNKIQCRSDRTDCTEARFGKESNNDADQKPMTSKAVKSPANSST